jgi:hypothetical protein
MGVIHRVRDAATGRNVVLKQLRSPESGALEKAPHDKELKLSFQKEFHTLAGFDHPSIVAVHDFGFDGADPFYTMEWLDGSDLSSLVQCSIEEACAALRQVASALAFLHSKGFIHRDLTLANVRITSDGKIKLIDFGALTTSGAVPTTIIGTPPFIAPECLQNVPLDHRVDLFALGAVIYKLLTGKHAYSAASLTELSAVWKKLPCPPLELRAEVPKRLSELTMALLSPDRMARPSSASEVIDRLCAIGGLAPLPRNELATGYLRSTTLIGRTREMSAIRDHLDHVAQGTGAALIVEAVSGAGKSRLLSEAALLAQLAGCTVVQVDASSGRGPYGTIELIAQAMLRLAPDEAVRLAHPYAADIARTVPSLNERLGSPKQESIEDPVALRQRAHRSLVAWFLDMFRARTCAILIDDVQRCDEASAAVCAALAQQTSQAPYFLMAALRTDEHIRATAGVKALCNASTRISLSGLDGAGLRNLVAAIFGPISRDAELAKWLEQKTDGGPMLCTELIAHLVATGAISYAEGTWRVIGDLEDGDVPLSLRAMLDDSVQRLSAEARYVGQCLAVLGGELPLATCIDLCNQDADATPGPHETTFNALDELIRVGALVTASSGFRFRHDGLREALLRTLDEPTKRMLHKRAAKVLCPTGDPPRELLADIGWHLYHGGDELKGAEYLEQAGCNYYERQLVHDATPLLRAADTAYERNGILLPQRLRLRNILIISATFQDRKMARRLTDVSLEAALCASGLTNARRLAPFVGAQAGIALGIVWAVLNRPLRTGGRPIPMPFEALSIAIGIATAGSAIAALEDDHETGRKCAEALRIFSYNTHSIGYACFCLAQAMLVARMARDRHLESLCQEALEAIEHDHQTPVRDIDRRIAIASCHSLLLSAHLQDQHPDTPAQLERLKAVGLPFYYAWVAQGAAIYHLARGEVRRAEQHQNDLERCELEIGVQWNLQAISVCSKSLALAWIHDVVGLRDCVEELRVFERESPLTATYRILAHGQYLKELGELEAACGVFEELDLRATPLEVTLSCKVALAETWLLMDRYEAARSMGLAAIDRVEASGARIQSYSLRAAWIVAVADAHLGNLEAAFSRIERASELAKEYASPTLCGPIHEAWAHIAHLNGDEVLFRKQCGFAERWYLPTEHPPLISRVRVLRSRGRMATSNHPTSGEMSHEIDPKSDVETIARPGAHSREQRFASSSNPTSNATTLVANTSRNQPVSSQGAIEGYREVRTETEIRRATPIDLVLTVPEPTAPRWVADRITVAPRKRKEQG